MPAPQRPAWDLLSHTLKPHYPSHPGSKVQEENLMPIAVTGIKSLGPLTLRRIWVHWHKYLGTGVREHTLTCQRQLCPRLYTRPSGGVLRCPLPALLPLIRRIGFWVACPVTGGLSHHSGRARPRRCRCWWGGHGGGC